MYKKIKEPIHFIGIGGIGMSGIAEVLCRLGFPVSGSDAADSAVVSRLRSMGVRVHIGHAAENLGTAGVVVYSSAIQSSNPEITEAKRLGLPLVPRAEMLAELMRLKYGIAIAGTHGKTTTTSMVAAIMAHAKLDPTIIVGGKVGQLGGNAKLGQGQFLVAEADESDGSFLKLSPVLNIITNIDNDHLDYYGSMDKLRTSFVQFANKVPYYGRSIICSDDPEIAQLIPQIEKRYWTYGFEPRKPQSTPASSHFQITNYMSSSQNTRFTVSKDGEKLCDVVLKFPGRHYALNATAALAIALDLDVDLSTAVEALGNFAGVGRRFDIKGTMASPKVTIVDDYGHHPTEIKATLEAARQFWGKNRVVVAFQPHRYSRTQICWHQFAQSLAAADHVFLMNIYAAGEQPIAGIDSVSLAKTFKTQSVTASGDVDATVKTLRSFLKDGDLLVTLGAGSVTQVGPQLLSS